MNGSCAEYPPEELLRGIGEFNAGEWFGCHETMEELWAGEQREVKYLYQGILQVAVALHHWREGNFRGALFLFGSAERLLGRVEPACQGVDTAALAADAGRLREALERLGEERMETLDPAFIPRIRFVPETS
ncbi:DUF309 domain-containing protein [Geobacter sp.]|uniref:DUF309 domain-containing protein n=1 Tax=Geobacter sp. TaxID=46610 RepID=UPI002613A9E5|nr:DUF309 domain-containing protein [Geobacter sp.]